jgi:hypothetical protein
MRISHTRVTRALVALTTAVAAAALLAATALAGPAFAPGGAEFRTPDGITLQQSGGVTPTDLARAVPRDEGVAPVISTSTETGSSGWFVDRELALGFGVGLALAIVSVALVMSRRRISLAHS